MMSSKKNVWQSLCVSTRRLGFHPDPTNPKKDVWQLLCVVVAMAFWCGCSPPPVVNRGKPSPGPNTTDTANTTSVVDSLTTNTPAEAVQFGLDATEETVEELVEDAAESTEPAKEAVEDAVEEAAESVEEAQESIQEGAEEAAAATEEVMDETVEVANEASDATEEVVEETIDTTSEAVEPGEEAVKETAKEAAEAVEPAKEAVKENVEEAAEAIEAAKESVQETAEKATQSTEEVMEDAFEEASEAIEPAKEAAEEVAPGETVAEPEVHADEVAAADDAAVAVAATSDGVTTGDWPCWGGDMNRNMVNATTGISIDFEPAEDASEGKNVLWTAKLGSQTYGNAVVADGKVWVGTNNGAEYRPQHEGDRGCVLCFDEKSGDFLWQLTRTKLPQGRVNDWPEQGICSTPAIEGDRMWVVTNRCELMCLDTEGFLDDENDGPYTEEVDKEKQDADIIWNLDMIEELGVFPHNLATSSPVVYGDLVFILTSNGVDEAHLEIPSPRSPCFLAVNKKTGEIAWESNEPFDNILHGQWSSPAVGVVNGQAQVYMPGGDGWLYAFEAESGEEIWRFDLNPKDSKWELGGRGTRNAIIATPVFYENCVILGVGQDPEHGEGVGHIYRIDCTKKGDVSPVTEDNKPNPNTAMVWHLGGIDEDGKMTGKEGAEAFRRTMSTVSIKDGLVYAPDLSGRIHCIDYETGRRYWEADVLAAIWGSTMVADGKVFLGDEDGIMSIFETGKELKKIKEIEFNSSIYSTPTIANGVMFVTDRSRLYAIKVK